jgi:hypothetical protein
MHFDRQVPTFWIDTATSVFRVEEYIMREEIGWIKRRVCQHWGNTSNTKLDMPREGAI